jgi:integrase
MAGVRERGGRYLGYYKESGKQKGVGTFGTYDEALHAARVAEAGRPVKEVTINPATIRGKMTVAGYMPVFLAGHKLRETSRESYGEQAKHVIKHLGSVCLCDLTPAMVRTFARTLEKSSLAPATVQKIMMVFRQMCVMAVVDKLMDSDPTAAVKAGGRGTTEMRILTKDEYKRVVACITPHYALLVETLVSTGMRWGEVLAIKADAITKIGRQWVIRVKRTYVEVGGKAVLRDFGKTPNAVRNVSVPESLAKRLLAAAGPDGFIFKTVRGMFITRSWFRREFRAAQKKAGISGVRVHDLRHTHATWLLADGVPLLVVRDRLGHSNIAVTSRYLHFIDTGTDAAGSAVDHWSLVA